MSVHDAELDDIYVDGAGKLWRVVAICHEPTVTVEEVEGNLPTRSEYGGAAQAMIGMMPPSWPSIIKSRMSGGTSGFMWDGFKRIWRKPENVA